MINFIDKKTWPSHIYDVIYNNRLEIEKELEQENKIIISGDNYIKAIEKPKYNWTLEYLIKNIRKYDACVWHCTKLIEKEIIFNEGLKPLKKEYIKEVIDNLKRNGESEKVLYEVRKKAKEFEEAKGFSNRESMIWFVFTEDMTNTIGCEGFFRYYGGEVTRRILGGDEEFFFPILEKIGTPYIIKCKIAIGDIAEYQISALAKSLIGYILAAERKECDYAFEAECYIRTKVEPENIIEIKKHEKSNRYRRSFFQI